MIPYKFLLLCGILTLTSCTNESTSDLIDTTLVENVTYSANIKPIIENSCLDCHGSPTENGAIGSFTTYETVKQYTQNNSIIDRISREAGQSGFMPLGGTKLPPQTIDLIIKWKDQGCPE
jgi:hypothetical protein